MAKKRPPKLRTNIIIPIKYRLPLKDPIIASKGDRVAVAIAPVKGCAIKPGRLISLLVLGKLYWDYSVAMRVFVAKGDNRVCISAK
jgi:hypothetical protein